VQGRSYAHPIAEHLDTAAEGDGEACTMVARYTLAYADLVTGHIQKENGFLFNMADQMLPPEEHARLEQDYQAAVPAGASAETGSHYEGIVEKMCRQWNIDFR
jgi:hemerythrin-like domain-containing protein